jgi:hypothetical protein
LPLAPEPVYDLDLDSCEADDDFDGVWLKNVDKVTARKSIVIFGIPRGGTMFAASVFARLGVPFSRSDDRKIGRIYEHRDLKAACADKNADSVRRIASEFSAEYAVWASLGSRLVEQPDPNPESPMTAALPLATALCRERASRAASLRRISHRGLP